VYSVKGDVGLRPASRHQKISLQPNLRDHAEIVCRGLVANDMKNTKVNPCKMGDEGVQLHCPIDKLGLCIHRCKEGPSIMVFRALKRELYVQICNFTKGQ
jgi:hypothetical protein